jgi:hypothetical protein
MTIVTIKTVLAKIAYVLLLNVVKSPMKTRIAIHHAKVIQKQPVFLHVVRKKDVVDHSYISLFESFSSFLLY